MSNEYSDMFPSVCGSSARYQPEVGTTAAPSRNPKTQQGTSDRGNRNSNDESPSTRSRSDMKELMRQVGDLRNRLRQVEDLEEHSRYLEDRVKSLEERNDILDVEEQQPLMVKRNPDEEITSNTSSIFHREETNNDETDHDALTQRNTHNTSNLRSALSMERVKFARDTFGFLIIARPLSIPFLTALFVVALKNTIFGMILYDLTRDGGLEIPVLVAVPVFVSQVISYSLAVLTQNDLLSGLAMTYFGYSPDISVRFTEGGTYWQWVTSVVLSFFDGAVGLSTTFLLVVTSSKVIDVLLNFAAVTFVSNLDENFFLLATQGLLGKANEQAAETITLRSYQRQARMVKSHVVHTLLLVFLLTATTGAGIYFYASQRTGAFASQSIYMQFGDDTEYLGAHSGFYKIDTKVASTRKAGFVYREERNGGGMIGYCVDKSRWTFTKNTNDACQNILAESSETDSFDVIDAAADTWFVRLSGSLQSIPLQDFYLSTGCDTDSDCGGSAHGRCSSGKNVCICEPGYTGVQCLYPSEAICPTIALDELFGLSFATQRAIASSFHVYPQEVYNRPVYINNVTQDVIFFSGVRWAIAHLDQLFDGIVTGSDALSKLVSPTFHSSEALNVDLLSDRVLYRTTQDSEGSPVDLQWFAASESIASSESAQHELAPISDSARFLCTKCNNATNQCFYEGTCSIEGKCECDHGATGTLCQRAPLGNGFCDTFFNRGDFKYDGGDCCRSTCVSTEEHTCGVMGLDGIDNADVGFITCSDPALTESCTGSGPCYILSNPLSVVPASRPRPWMSSNGNIMAISETYFGTVKVLERDGSGWIQRGQTLQGSVEGLHPFGSSISIASPPSSVLKKRGGKVPLYLAVSEDMTTRIFHYGTSGDRWTESAPIEPDIGAECFVRDEEVVAIGFRSDYIAVLQIGTEFEFYVSFKPDQNQHKYRLYYQLAGQSAWNLGYSGFASAAALSGDGSVFVRYKEGIFTLSSYYKPTVPAYGDLVTREFDVSVQGEIKSIQLDRLGEELTIVSQSNSTNTAWINRFDITTSEAASIGQSDDIYAPWVIPGVHFSTEGVIFSNEGSTVALYGANPSYVSQNGESDDIANSSNVILDVQVFSLQEGLSVKYEQTMDTFELVTPLDAFGTWSLSRANRLPFLTLSEHGNSVSYVNGGATGYGEVQLLDLVHRCKNDEMTVRISATYGVSSSNRKSVGTWNMVSESYFPLANMNVFDKIIYWTKDRLYEPRNFQLTGRQYENTIAANEFCIPTNTYKEDCLRFSSGSLYVNDQIEGSGEVIVVSKDQTSKVMSVPKHGANQMSSVVLGSEQAADCPVLETPQCNQYQVLFSMVLPSFANVLSTRIFSHPFWQLSNGETSILWSSNAPAGPLLAEQHCLPASNSCYKLEFPGYRMTNTDNWEEFAIRSNITGWLGSTMIFNDKVENFADDIFFGENCYGNNGNQQSP